MAFNEQRNKNKAKVWTVIVHLLLMLWFAFYGLTYQDPPPEEGIAINFGYEETELERILKLRRPFRHQRLQRQ